MLPQLADAKSINRSDAEKHSVNIKSTGSLHGCMKCEKEGGKTNFRYPSVKKDALHYGFIQFQLGSNNPESSCSIGGRFPLQFAISHLAVFALKTRVDG